MAGQCIEKIECPQCHKNNLQVFQDEKNKITGYCFSCGNYNDNPYRDKPEGYKPKAFKKKSPEQIQKEIQEIGEYQTLSLPDRKLTKEGLEYFGIKIGVSEVDGVTPISHYYPYYKDGELVGWKTRWIDTKKMWGIGQTNDVDLFGWDKAIGAGGKKLFITEGECDAVALFQIFKDYNKGNKYEHLNPPIVSLPHGCGDADKVLSKLITKIRQHFKEIVLVFDNDAPGNLAVENVMKVIPEAVSATLPCKDANECLIEGKGRACYAAVVFNPQKPKNTRIINGSLLHEKAKEPPTLGYSWPWRHLTRATRGMRTGETVYIGAAPKMG